MVSASSANQSVRSRADHTPTLFTQPPRLVLELTSGLTVTTRAAAPGASRVRSSSARPSAAWVVATPVGVRPKSGGTWNPEKVRADLHSTWSVDYESQMESVGKAVRAGGEKLENWLDDTSAGNNPAVIRTLAALGRDPNFLDASKAQGKIDKVMNDPKHPYWKGSKQA